MKTHKPLWNAQEQNTKIEASHSKRLKKQMIEIEEKMLDQTKAAFIKHDTITVLCSSIVVHMPPFTSNYILAVGVLLQKSQDKVEFGRVQFSSSKRQEALESVGVGVVHKKSNEKMKT